MMTVVRHQIHPVSINLLKLGKKKFEPTDVYIIIFCFLITQCIYSSIIKWDPVEFDASELSSLTLKSAELTQTQK